MQVTRRRRVARSRSGILGRLNSRRRLVQPGIASITLVFACANMGSASTQQFGRQQVGQITDKGEVISSDQYIDPIGQRLVIDNGKIMSSTVSPDGTHLAAMVADGLGSLVVVNLKSWQVQQVIGSSTGVDLKISGND